MRFAIAGTGVHPVNAARAILIQTDKQISAVVITRANGLLYRQHPQQGSATARRAEGLDQYTHRFSVTAFAMGYSTLFQSKAFKTIYRVLIPLIIVTLLFVVPLSTSTSKRIDPFDWIILLFVTVALTCAYYSITLLGEIPSKGHAWLRQWARFGTFRNNQFIPYFDRSSLCYLYFFNAIGESMVISIGLRWIFVINSIFSVEVSTVIAVVNFFLLFVPFIGQYRTFEQALYP